MKKIPGELPPLKKENPGYIENLGKKSKLELEEILQRQNNLLVNKNFIAKLPDKGEKIIRFRDKVLKELENKNEIEKAAELLSKLNIASHGKAAMNELEWTGKYSEESSTKKVIELDSEDEEDPLKILAQPTGSGVHKKKVIYLPHEKSLIKPEDLEDITPELTKDQVQQEKDVSSSRQTTSKNVETNSEPTKSEIKGKETDIIPEANHVNYLIGIAERKKDRIVREPFKPHKTTIKNEHDPEREKNRRKHKFWENTAATPPLIQYNKAVELSLSEVLELQKIEAAKLKVIQAKHAAERLAERIFKFPMEKLPAQMGTYRENEKSSSESESEDEEQVFDDEDDDKGGTVTFKVDASRDRFVT